MSFAVVCVALCLVWGGFMAGMTMRESASAGRDDESKTMQQGDSVVIGSGVSEDDENVGVSTKTYTNIDDIPEDIRNEICFLDSDEFELEKVKVVKNKVAAPFDQAEFDILYSCGISREGSIIDAALSRGVIEKRGSWFAFGDVQIAQGQLAAIEYLKANPEITDKIIEAVKASPDRVAPALKKAA